MCPIRSGGRWFRGPAGVVRVVGTVVWRSGGVSGVDALPGDGQVIGPGPAGWDLEDPLVGVGDQSGGCGEVKFHPRTGHWVSCREGDGLTIADAGFVRGAVVECGM